MYIMYIIYITCIYHPFARSMALVGVVFKITVWKEKQSVAPFAALTAVDPHQWVLSCCFTDSIFQSSQGQKDWPEAQPCSVGVQVEGCAEPLPGTEG